MSVQLMLFYKYDPSGTTLNYGRFLDPFNMKGFASTSGSSTTTTATESTGLGSTPFDVVTVGDVLKNQDNVGTTLYRIVTAKASSISLTVDTAWTLGAAGKSLVIYHRLLGTTSTDGWFSTAWASQKTVRIVVSAIGSTSTTYSIEGKMAAPDATAQVIATAAITTVTSVIVAVADPWDFMRVGLKDTSGAGTDAIEVYFVASDILPTSK